MSRTWVSYQLAWPINKGSQDSESVEQKIFSYNLIVNSELISATLLQSAVLLTTRSCLTADKGEKKKICLSTI
jgi:hypothetical protein